MYKGFQRNAFQTPYPGPLYAFQGAERFVEILADEGDVKIIPYLDIKVEVDDVATITTYKAISLIVLRATIRDPSIIPYILFDPDSVKVYLYDPLGTLVLNGVNMTKISIGQYNYFFQTTINSPLGIWEISIKATNGSNVFQTLKQVAFIISDK